MQPSATVARLITGILPNLLIWKILTIFGGKQDANNTRQDKSLKSFLKLGNARIFRRK